MYYDSIPSPIGDITLIWNEAGLHVAEFSNEGKRLSGAMKKLRPTRAPDGMINKAPWPKAFEHYFADNLHAFDGLSLVLEGSDFQRKVWAALQRIEVGTTKNYGEIALEIGSPGAARAVGTANGQNPVAIIVPCHRVIASDGTLAGYGGGVDRKHWLLRHEGAILV